MKLLQRAAVALGVGLGRTKIRYIHQSLLRSSGRVSGYSTAFLFLFLFLSFSSDFCNPNFLLL